MTFIYCEVYEEKDARDRIHKQGLNTNIDNIYRLV
jgi:hypothetical protein